MYSKVSISASGPINTYILDPATMVLPLLWSVVSDTDSDSDCDSDCDSDGNKSRI